MDMPLSLIISYSIFNFFLFYQQLHVKNLKGESEGFESFLVVFTFVGMLFCLGFLIYWGYKVGWLQAAALFGITFAIKFVWFPIEAKLGLRNSYGVFSLAGFIALPISGYFMWAALP